jgi:Tol biopolymer transport system component
MRRIPCLRIVIFVLGGFAFAASTALSANLIAYVDRSGDLYVSQPDGSSRQKLASGEILQHIAFPTQFIQEAGDFYSWPVWSPDGNRLACFHVAPGDPESIDGLYIFDVNTSQVLHSYQEPGLRPIYAYWAPHGQHLAVLLGGQGAFSLGLWPIAHAQRPKTVAQGAPFYFDWRADAQALLIHTGSDPDAAEGHSVSLLDIASGKRQLVSRSPAAFGPPSWSADGKWLAYGDNTTAGEQATLMIANGDGNQPQSFGTLPEKMAMSWSPTQPLLAVASSSFVGDPLLEELRLIDVSSNKTQTLIKDNFAAYFWSPDGKRILYAKRKLGTDLWAWTVIEVANGQTYDVVDFVPSRPLLLVFQYFDQYALSHRFWSPDSKAFVFPGAAGPDARPAIGLRDPTIYAVEATKGATPKALSDGHIAFWSPK